MSAFAVFQAVTLVLIAVGATAVVLTRDPKRQVFVSALFSLVQTILYFAIQSPDVGLSELVVGVVALPVLVLLTLARIEGKPR